MAALASGDGAAIEALYRELFEPVYAFVFWRVGGVRSDAEDVTQETFLTALSSLDRFQGRSSLYTWMWGLAKHGDQKAIAESLAIMKDEQQPAQLRGALGGNLLLLHDPELLPIVDETVRQFAQMEQVGMLAVEYYKNVATAEARSRLEAMSSDSKLAEPVRKAAGEALRGK